MNTKELAKALYLKNQYIEVINETFLSELEKRTVIDKREQGYYCRKCNQMTKSVNAFLQKDQVVYPPNTTEIWIVNRHYDGCNGWD
jgi:uncharacterized protein YnzC (UPF0291/DUF896 family)